MSRVYKLSSQLSVIIMCCASIFGFSACRKPLYDDVLKIGALDIPQNLMPYNSHAGTSTLIAGLIYDPLLGTQLTPADYSEGKDYIYPDGETHKPINNVENPYKFTDSLVGVDGAYEKKEGSKVGRVYYKPDEKEVEALKARKNLRQGYTVTNEIIENETIEQFEARSALEVPLDHWSEYTFEIIEGNNWNDGSPFTASDIKFTFDYIIKHRASFGAMSTFLANYSHSKVSDGGKFFTMYLCTDKKSEIKTICNSILILPKHIFENITEPEKMANTENPIGTGAYRIEQYSQGDNVVLKVREDITNIKRYFSGEPINYIMLKKLENIEIQLTALNKGDIDVIWESMDSEKVSQIKNNKAYSNIKFSSVKSDFVTTLLFNMGENGRFGNSGFGGKGSQLRQAISLAINQDELISNVLYNNGSKVNGGLVASSQPHSLVDENGNYLKHIHSFELANNMLEEAGFIIDQSSGYRKSLDGSDLKIRLLHHISNERLAYSLGSALKKVGLNVILEKADNQAAREMQYGKSNKWDMYINNVSFSSDKLLMFDARYGVYLSGEPRLFNYSGIKDGKLLKLIADMDNEKGILMQFEKARELQRYLSKQYIELPIYIKNNISAYTEKNYLGFIAIDSSSIFNSVSLKFLKKVG